MEDASIGANHSAFLALFRTVLEAAPDATLVIDSRGQIIFANRATEDSLGWAPAALIGLPVETLVPGRAQLDHRAQRARYGIRPLMRTMGAGRELTAVRNDGTELAVEISLNPIPVDTGVLTICVVRDISERQRIQQELRELNTHLEERVTQRTLELQAANRELEMLAYSIAHDLRAPLRAINGYSVQLAEAAHEGRPEDAMQCLDGVASRVSRMSSMIDDYLHLLSIGRQELVRESLSMHVIAQEALSSIGSFNAHVRIEPMPSVQGDRTLILEVWLQLLRNAIKFSANTNLAAIRAAAYEHDRFVFFQVDDNGVGFDPAYADKLFQLFERLHAAKDFAGNGIGLCLVKRIVERHGGGVKIEGRPDEGVRVTFWLPKDPG